MNPLQYPNSKSFLLMFSLEDAKSGTHNGYRTATKWDPCAMLSSPKKMVRLPGLFFAPCLEKNLGILPLLAILASYTQGTILPMQARLTYCVNLSTRHGPVNQTPLWPLGYPGAAGAWRRIF